MTSVAPIVWHGDVLLRLVRLRDAKALEMELVTNRAWLKEWEATSPGGHTSFDMRASVKNLLKQFRDGSGIPFIIEWKGELVGQLNVFGIARGASNTATIGYWLAERAAGHNIAPQSVALATDYCFNLLGLHRMEICIRPENAKSLRVVEKLGFSYEGFRPRFIHIDGAWRDHYAFSLRTEQVAEGVLARFESGNVPPINKFVQEYDSPHHPN